MIPLVAVVFLSFRKWVPLCGHEKCGVLIEPCSLLDMNFTVLDYDIPVQ